MTPPGPTQTPCDEFRLRNEFAFVRVTLDQNANGPRLVIEDLKTGTRSHFDPLMLEALAWIAPESFAELMDPRHRWPLSEFAGGGL